MSSKAFLTRRNRLSNKDKDWVVLSIKDQNKKKQDPFTQNYPNKKYLVSAILTQVHL